MSNMKREWEKLHEDEAERAWREAGLTRATFDKLMAFADKLRNEGCNCEGCDCSKDSDDSK
jgi:hypothetical protein